MEEGSQVLLEGETEAAQKGLGIADEHDGVWMPGVLSRKKQVAAPSWPPARFSRPNATTGSRKPRAPVVFCARRRVVSWIGVPVPLSK